MVAIARSTRRQRPVTIAGFPVAGAVVALVAQLLWVLAPRASFWGDEAFVAAMMRLPVGTLVRDLSHVDVNMSTYYLSARLWTSAIGLSEGRLRAFSVVCVVAALAAAYPIVRRVAGARVAGWTVMFLGLNPFVSLIALTARPYAMLLLMCVVATGAFERALRTDRTIHWAIYGVLAVLALYTHLTGVFLIGSHVVFGLLVRRLPTARSVAAAVVIGVGAIPMLLFIAPKDTLNWLGPANWESARQAAVSVGGTGALLVVTVFLGVLALGRVSPVPGSVKLALLVGIVVPIIGIAALLPVQSLVVDIYLTVMLLPLSALAACGIATFTTNSAQWRAVALAVFVSSIGLHDRVWVNPSLASQNWRGVSTHLSELVQGGDTVGFPNTFYRIATEYYASDGPRPAAWLAARPILPTDPWLSRRPYELDRIKRLRLQLDEVALYRDIAGRSRVWLVGLGDLESQTIDRWMLDAGYVIAHHDADLGINIDLYVRS